MMHDRAQMRLDGVADGALALCGPEQIHIDLTNACTLHCLCCWHRSPLVPASGVAPHWNPRHSLPFEVALRVIDEAAALGVERIIYSGGGDPLLYPRLFDILRRTAERGMETMLVSTLAVASEETVRRIVASGVDRLLVSLWAGDEEGYLRMHPGAPPGSFAKVVSLLNVLARLRPPGAKPRLVTMNVVSARNAGDVEKMIRLALDAGAGEVWFQPVDVEHEGLKPLLLGREQIEGLIATLERCANEYRRLLKPGQDNLLGFGEFIEKLRNSRAEEGIFHSDVIDTIPCYMGWYECRILANGDVVPCCKADRFPLGNILGHSLRDIWFSSRYGEFRQNALALPKTDAYFEKIRCGKVCDDWWLNKQVHHRVLQRTGARERGGQS